MTRLTISAIVAMTENYVIGKNNQLPWHLPADLKHFKTLTTGQAVLMGRKTFESIGKPLPNRLNLILTKNTALQISGCEIVHTLADAERKTLHHVPPINELFIIGGGEIFKIFLSHVEKLYLTLIHTTLIGDAFFPKLNEAEWEMIDEERFPANEQHPYDYSFITLVKKSTNI
jgi:dihydrofolate reductase